MGIFSELVCDRRFARELVLLKDDEAESLLFLVCKGRVVTCIEGGAEGTFFSELLCTVVV